MTHTYEYLRELVVKELDEIVKRGELDENTLACAYKLVDIVKDLNEIEMTEPNYQQAGYPYAMGYASGNYNDGYSSRRRDSMGRYASYAGRGYSRDGIMDKMERMMAEAGSESERQAIQKVMNQL